MTLVLGFSHLLTILQSPGIPARTLPSSKRKTKQVPIFGIAKDIIYFISGDLTGCIRTIERVRIRKYIGSVIKTDYTVSCSLYRT
jgi:hypothetical protein